MPSNLFAVTTTQYNLIDIANWKLLFETGPLSKISILIIRKTRSEGILSFELSANILTTVFSLIFCGFFALSFF